MAYKNEINLIIFNKKKKLKFLKIKDKKSDFHSYLYKILIFSQSIKANKRIHLDDLTL